jgi:hypothetical protein
MLEGLRDLPLNIGIGYNFPYFKELLDNPVGKVCCPEWICFWAAFIKDSVSNILG